MKDDDKIKFVLEVDKIKFYKLVIIMTKDTDKGKDLIEKLFIKQLEDQIKNKIDEIINAIDKEKEDDNSINNIN